MRIPIGTLLGLAVAGLASPALAQDAPPPPTPALAQPTATVAPPSPTVAPPTGTVPPPFSGQGPGSVPVSPGGPPGGLPPGPGVGPFPGMGAVSPGMGAVSPGMGGVSPGTGAPPPTPGVVPAKPEIPGRLARRVGFGIGLWSTPGYAFGQGSGALGNSYLGAQIGIRWWVSERLAILPSLTLGVNHTSTGDSKNDFGEVVKGYETTSGTVAPMVVFSYAAYVGQTTRFMLSAGPGFVYSVQPVQGQRYPDGTEAPPTKDAERFTAAAIAGFALEQFFTSRLSLVVGVDAPVLAVSVSQTGEDDASTSVSADFNSTRVSASVFLYID